LTSQQIILFSLIGLVLVGLLWGRWRYDLVAFAALVAGVITGVIPAEEAFAGFSHEATIIVALVLIISAGLMRSGAVDLITRLAIDRTRSLAAHITLMGVLGGALSAFMNNVAALALLMPVDIQAARQAGRSPARTLMPLSFATILGGMATLIGTPPNIIIAAYRNEALGAPFAMFDFAPVGLAAAAAGLAFIALVGWRLIPLHGAKQTPMEELAAIGDYIAELVVPENAKIIGQKVRDLDEIAEENDCLVLGLVRKSQRLPGRARAATIAKNDILIIQGSADALNALSGAMGIKFQGKAGQIAELTSELTLAEAVITRDSRLINRSANEIQLLRAHGVSMIGLSRNGKTVKDRVRRTKLQAGDILLLLGDASAMNEVFARLGTLPLADRNLNVTRHDKAWGAIALFATAIGLGAFGLLPLPIALAMVAIGLVLFDILPLRELYDSVEWPVIVLLGSMIPLGAALDETGSTLLIANWLANITGGLPGWVALTVILVTTMTLSDVLNNTATTIIAAPIAIQLANTLGTNPDAFLMAVAIGASCAFLTPIGHKNNMLILGPGGYRFGDYWRMGLPLELLVVAVSVPMILLVWPM
jgi:di/tricarboxylate transporter